MFILRGPSKTFIMKNPFFQLYNIKNLNIYSEKKIKQYFNKKIHLTSKHNILMLRILVKYQILSTNFL